MTKLEKVLKGLECCKTDPYFESDCEDKECPYRTDSMHCIDCLCTDALELLKEQEPRVLTLEEVPDAVFCYLECKAYGTIEPAIFGEADIYDTVAFTTLEDGNDYLDLIDYCITWRCWSTKPTDEQRKAVKWEWV